MISCKCELVDPVVPPPDPFQASKLVDFCPVNYRLTGSQECLEGKYRVISNCDSTGAITEVSRVLLDAQCNPVVGTYDIIEKICALETEWQCEYVSANVDLCLLIAKQYTMADLIQLVIDSGVTKFPSGELLAGDCPISGLIVAVLPCGANCGSSKVSTSSVKVLFPNGDALSFDGGGSREFEAECGYPIQPIQYIDVAAGSGVAICIKISNWVQCVV